MTEDYPLAGVAGAVEAGMSARAGLNAFRESGGQVRDATWYRMFGEYQRHLSEAGEEPGRPLNRYPTGDEITQWSTVDAEGYLQRVEVLTRNRGTGEVEWKPWSRAGDSVLTRQGAISDALDSFASNADGYDEQILGAVYVGTHELIPGGDV